MNLYKINSDLNYTIDDLREIHNIDQTILKTKDLLKVEKYYQDCNQIITAMKSKVGEISLIDNRQNMGYLKADNLLNRFKYLANKHQGHFDQDIHRKSLNELIEMEKEINEYHKLELILKQRYVEEQVKKDKK